jgi:hypothetical protein
MIGIVTIAAMISAMTTMTATMKIMIGIGRTTLGGGRVATDQLMRTSSAITRWQRRNKKGSSGLVVVRRRPCEPLNNPTLHSLGGGSHLKRESHPSPIGLVF